MPERFHQTVRLSRGRHSSPRTGMCVMELASTLAGEDFSDHPRSVCPVLGAFLREYNDLTGHELRQDLIPYAARVVGTRGGADAEAWRAQRCLRWAQERLGAQLPRWAWRRRAIARGSARGTRLGRRRCAAWAARRLRGRAEEVRGATLSLLDDLVTAGLPTADAAVAAPESANPSRRGASAATAA